jgi:tRNA-splicing ligase RtcB (3'-phosphate/5'-hydroxy nucleic acid ligase)
MINIHGTDETKPIKIWTNDIEDEALLQLKKLSRMPFIHSHIAVMPDVHHGMGSTIGTVIATKGAIIPAAVGVDIGCGMCALKLPFKVDAFGDNLEGLRHSIERSIPVGFRHNSELNDRTSDVMECLGLTAKEALQLGTLGGGNHFIEICQDENNDAWVLLHSGSRGMGKQRAEIHIDKAKGLMKQYFINTPDVDLAYLAQGTEEFDAYLEDLMLAQAFALNNRHEMLIRIAKDIAFFVYGHDCDAKKMIEILGGFRVDCHHNYTQQENHFGQNVWITRKGALSARKDQYGIIPGSMGTKSYIVKGLGNLDSFCSCSHGAGRKMSRTAARKQFTIEDLIEQTNGVECRKDKDVIDEIPGAYKSIDQVMKNQEDLVEIVHTLNQLICIKG